MPEDNQQPAPTPTLGNVVVPNVHPAGTVISPEMPVTQPEAPQPATSADSTVPAPTVQPEIWPSQPAAPVAAATPEPIMPANPLPVQEAAAPAERTSPSEQVAAPPAAYVEASAGTSTLPAEPLATDTVVPPPAKPAARSNPLASIRPKLVPMLRTPAGIAALAIMAALVIGGGFVFGFYLPNTPSGVFSGSLSNTASAIDTLVAYTKQQDAAHYKGVDYDGTMHLKSSSGSADATLTGSSDESGNASLSVAADVMGEKATVNVRTIQVAGNTSPDVYLQIAGLKPLFNQQGLDGFDSLDGQWISIDHTFLDTYAAQLRSDGSSSSSQSDAVKAPTYVQLNDAAEKMQMVNRQYLFTTNGSRAVLQMKKFIGTEHAGGRTLNHYIVGWDKQHLTAYVDALKTALDSSKLNDWAKAVSGKNLSVMLDLDSTKADAQNAKSDYTFDLWADTGTRLVSKVSFADPSDSNSVFSIAQDYHGGSSYPISVMVTSKDANGNSQNGSFGLTVDTATHKYTGTFAMNSTDTSGTTTLDATVHATPGNKPAEVAVPAGAKSLTDVLSSLGLGGLVSPGQGGASGAALAPFVLQQ